MDLSICPGQDVGGSTSPALQHLWTTGIKDSIKFVFEHHQDQGFHLLSLWVSSTRTQGRS